MSNRGEVFFLDLHGLANGNSGPFREEDRLIAWPSSDPQPLGPLDADVIWRYDMREEVGIHTHDSANVSVLLDGDFLYTSTPNGVDRTDRHPALGGTVQIRSRPGYFVRDRILAARSNCAHAATRS